MVCKLPGMVHLALGSTNDVLSPDSMSRSHGD